MGCASANGSITLEPIPAASVVVAIQTAMCSFRVINDASTAHSRPPHYSRNALSQSRNDAVVRPPYSVSVRRLPAFAMSPTIFGMQGSFDRCAEIAVSEGVEGTAVISDIT
jgi:hypothetical protein